MNNYFSHDSNARDDEKILAMRIDLGWEAYGLYWALIEMLRDASDYQLKANYKVLAFSLHTTVDLIQQIICNYGLFSFTEDNESFFSHSLTKRMEEKEVVSKKRRASAGTRWGKPSTSDANAEQDGCKCNANAMQMHNTSDANAEQDGCKCNANASLKENKVKESKVNTSSPRTRESARSPNEEEKKMIYEIFFWRNIKNPVAEVERFCAHNQQYGWKFNDTKEKRLKAANEWIPETQGNRVSPKFLDTWKAIYAILAPDEEELKRGMLHEGSRAAASNGYLVIHAHGSVHHFVATRASREISVLAKGNPVRYTWP